MNKEKSITKNYLYNITLTMLNLLFPIITFPYVTRVLHATSLGKYNFALSVVSYFLVFASLGIPIYGVREIAKHKGNKKDVSKVFCEIYSINFISTCICSIIYFITVLTVPIFYAERNLFLVMGLILVLNLFNVDWLYQGFENYRYITTRSVIFKLISIGCLFLFVKQESDYVIYGLVSIIALSAANLVNIFTVRKYVDLDFRDVSISKHIRPVFILLSTQLAIGVYTNLDSTLLDIISGHEYLGYYTAATKINKMVVGVVVSLGVVLLPTLSNYIKNDMKVEFEKLISKSVKFILYLSLPACIGLYMLAPQITRLFSGVEFTPAISAMRITVLLIVFIGFGNLTSVQILMPLGKEKEILVSVVFGAIVDLLLNLMLIPKYQHNGAAIATCVAEFTVTFIQYLYVRKYMGNTIFKLDNLKYLIGSVLVLITTKSIIQLGLKDAITIIISIALSVVIYGGFCIISKEPITRELILKVKDKIS